jgi:poly-gamma-glutamate capsule biosynthesis protein CapA/YwtB (metallophosphatase superfamily)
MSSSHITLFVCGDVMTGRGIDQVLPHPCGPRIFEPYVRDARVYVDLAEDANGPIPKPVDFSHVWGDALGILERMAPDVRIINLETAVTACEEYWPGKGINYRMEPRNIPVITAAGIDVCTLANNHVLDWGYKGLDETTRTLRCAGVRIVGAGRNLDEAAAPAIVEVAGKWRVIVFGFGSASSGILAEWAATPHGPGVNLLPDLADGTVRAVAARVRGVKRRGDIVVASIHWGGNWGYEIPQEETAFAHRLIDEAGVDVVHGHSSHHVKGIEVYRGKPVIYGCGDFITDYEGIGGYDLYRGDLGLMYFVRMEPASGTLNCVRMQPTRMRNFRVNRASGPDAEWLGETLNREGKRFGTRVEPDRDDMLALLWR